MVSIKTGHGYEFTEYMLTAGAYRSRSTLAYKYTVLTNRAMNETRTSKN